MWLHKWCIALHRFFDITVRACDVYVCLLFTERVLDAAKIYPPTALVLLYHTHMYVHFVEVCTFDNPACLVLVK